MRTKLIFLGLIVSLVLTSFSWADTKKPEERGRYIYDERGILPLEPEMALSAYLWQIDAKTGYEIIIVFPEKKLAEAEIIQWFNTHGVGKEKIDNGAAIFVFPDNSVFLAIGSGNDKVSVTASKTYGEKILKDLDKDPVLALLRFTNLLGKRISEPTAMEKAQRFGQKVAANLDVIFLWALVIFLVVFLIQQRDGFQRTDLIVPVILIVLVGFFSLVSIGGSSEMFDTYKEYGIITSTEHSKHHWVQTVVISTGKTTTTTYIPHDDYINEVTLLSYNFKEYEYTFKTTDNKWAWRREVGETEALVIGTETGNLRNVYPVDDNSGGVTIGDGVWLNQK